MPDEILKPATIKKIIFILLSASLSVFCSAQSNISTGRGEKQALSDIPPDSSFRAFNFISLLEAKNILGQPAHVKDSLLKYTQGLLRYQFTYKTNFSDSITGKTSTLFFGMEQWEQTALAQRNYILLKTENEKNYVVTDLIEMGDEGFLAKDQLNNPFIMIRKDKKIFKLRLLNHVNTNSSEELQVIAKKIVSLH